MLRSGLMEYQCVKSVQRRIFFWSVFSRIGSNTWKYGAEKTPYLDTFHAVYMVPSIPLYFIQLTIYYVISVILLQIIIFMIWSWSKLKTENWRHYCPIKVYYWKLISKIGLSAGFSILYFLIWKPILPINIRKT